MPAGKARAEITQHRTGCGRGQTQRIDADIGVLAAVELEDVELHDAVDRRDQDLAAAEREQDNPPAVITARR